MTELVKDCETLLTIRDTITKPGRLYWNSQDSIFDWKGVIVDTDRSEPRVTGLELVYLYLNGTLPSELDRLTELEVLIVRDNHLSGEIPAALGRLSKLVMLDFGR